MIYNSVFIGGELEIVTEALHPEHPLSPQPVKITYYLNGKEITRHEAQALLDEAKRKAAH